MRVLSVRETVTIWFAGAALVLIGLMGLGVFVGERAVLDQWAKRSLGEDLSVVRTELDREPDDIVGIDGAGLAEALAVWRAGELLYASQNWRQFGLPDHPPAPGIRDLHGREVRVMLEELAGDRLLAVAHDETETSRAIGTLAYVLLASTPIAFVGVLLTGWHVAGRALEPVGALARQVERIEGERSGERVAVGREGDEFASLSRSINTMLDRLQSAMESQRRFVSDASHQLRTPLTAQRVVGEAVLRQHPSDAVALREVVESMLEEADQLSGLVSALLDLARTERVRSNFAETDLVRVCESVAEQLRPLGESTDLEIRVLGGPVRAWTDADALRRALQALVENSLAYCHRPGSVCMRVGEHRGESFVLVEDDGPGIAEADRGRIFEPFYRGQGVGSTAGSGLGLSIARAAARAAGGTLDLVNGTGACFRLSGLASLVLTWLSVKSSSTAGLAEAERLIQQRYTGAVLRRLDFDWQDKTGSIEAEVILDRRQGFVVLRRSMDGGWLVTQSSWRDASSRYRRLLSRIEDEARRSVGVESAVRAVLDRYRAAMVSEVELEFQGSSLVYEIELRADGIEFERHVNARSGRLIGMHEVGAGEGKTLEMVLAGISRGCDQGVPIGFSTDRGDLRFVRADGGMSEAPPCGELRNKLELIGRLFPVDGLELIEGSLRNEDDWVLWCEVRIGGEAVRLRVNASRGTLLADLGVGGMGS